MSDELGDEEELVNFEPDDLEEEDEEKNVNNENKKTGGGKKHVAMSSSAFTDFLLKPELLKAVVDCGFEHPSQVQHECIPQAILGNDLVCQAQSGMGKTAVFVLTILQQLDPESKDVQCLVLCHTRELAYQICSEFLRFTKYLKKIKTSVFFGGIPEHVNEMVLKSESPQIVVGTPGRIKSLIRRKILNVEKLRHFVVDEADKVLEALDMRQDVQEIFKNTPRNKQVMMFSATLGGDIRSTCRKFMKNPHEIMVDDKKLTLSGIKQYYIELTEDEKNKKLSNLLDALVFNQVVIFVRTTERAHKLSLILNRCHFPSICIHGRMSQEERIEKFNEFKTFKKRILVSTDLVGRGIDIQRVNIVINYDMPSESDQYLHRVGRAGRFGTKGLAISFITKNQVLPPVPSKFRNDPNYKQLYDTEVLKEVQERFLKEGKILPLPDQIDINSYMNA